jgi:SAM-dependent methyltransferase
MDESELRERIASFPRWHYEFDFGGVRTPIFDADHVNRHRQRKDYFFSPLVRLCGGSLAGRRVLDLGCNAGFWSLAAIEAGADFVLGIDGRQMHVDQARLVFEARAVEPARYRFRAADIFHVDLDEEPFDIVLCLGLLYHVSKPFELMERISAWNRDLLVIDTRVERVPGQFFRVVRQNVDEPRSAVDRAIALHPTSGAVVRLARTFEYQAVMLRPHFTDWEGCRSYRAGDRRAFMCAKRTALRDLDTERPGANADKPIVVTGADVIRGATVVRDGRVIPKATVVPDARVGRRAVRAARRLLRFAGRRASAP